MMVAVSGGSRSSIPSIPLSLLTPLHSLHRVWAGLQGCSAPFAHRRCGKNVEEADDRYIYKTFQCCLCYACIRLGCRRGRRYPWHLKWGPDLERILKWDRRESNLGRLPYARVGLGGGPRGHYPALARIGRK